MFNLNRLMGTGGALGSGSTIVSTGGSGSGASFTDVMLLQMMKELLDLTRRQCEFIEAMATSSVSSVVGPDLALPSSAVTIINQSTVGNPDPAALDVNDLVTVPETPYHEPFSLAPVQDGSLNPEVQPNLLDPEAVQPDPATVETPYADSSAGYSLLGF